MFTLETLEESRRFCGVKNFNSFNHNIFWDVLIENSTVTNTSYLEHLSIIVFLQLMDAVSDRPFCFSMYVVKELSRTFSRTSIQNQGNHTFRYSAKYRWLDYSIMSNSNTNRPPFIYVKLKHLNGIIYRRVVKLLGVRSNT